MSTKIVNFIHNNLFKIIISFFILSIYVLFFIFIYNPMNTEKEEIIDNKIVINDLVEEKRLYRIMNRRT